MNAQDLAFAQALAGAEAQALGLGQAGQLASANMEFQGAQNALNRDFQSAIADKQLRENVSTDWRRFGMGALGNIATAGALMAFGAPPLVAGTTAAGMRN
jgi:hypothetical protein